MTERKRLYPDVHFAIEERYSAAALKQACEVDKDKARRRIERKHAEDSLREEDYRTLAERTRRYLAVKPHEIIPNQHLAAVSEECAKLDSLVKSLCRSN